MIYLDISGAIRPGCRRGVTGVKKVVIKEENTNTKLSCMSGVLHATWVRTAYRTSVLYPSIYWTSLNVLKMLIKFNIFINIFINSKNLCWQKGPQTSRTQAICSGGISYTGLSKINELKACCRKQKSLWLIEWPFEIDRLLISSFILSNV